MRHQSICHGLITSAFPLGIIIFRYVLYCVSDVTLQAFFSQKEPFKWLRASVNTEITLYHIVTEGHI